MFQATTDSIGGASLTSDLTFEAGPPGKIEVSPKPDFYQLVNLDLVETHLCTYSGGVLCWASDAWPKQKGLQSHHSNHWWGIPKFFVHSVLYGFHYKNTIYMNWRIICCYFGRYNQRCSFNRLVLVWCQKYVLVDVSICSGRGIGDNWQVGVKGSALAQLSHFIVWLYCSLWCYSAVTVFFSKDSVNSVQNVVMSAPQTKSTRNRTSFLNWRNVGHQLAWSANPR